MVRRTERPSCPRFGTYVGPDTYASWLGDIPAEATACVHLHVPVRRAARGRCGCSTASVPHDGQGDGYAALLRSEIDLIAGRLEVAPQIRQVRFTGDTSTVMVPGALAGLVAALRARFPFYPAAEIALDIDPRMLTSAMIEALGRAGVTRARLEVPVGRDANRRREYLEAAAEAVVGLRTAGVRGIDLDLVHDSPHRTVTSYIETVQRCLEWRPDRVAVLDCGRALAPERRRPSGVPVPDGSACRTRAEVIAGALVAVGYRWIGLDHYALPDDPMELAYAEGRLRRNLLGYTTDPCDVLLGLGASAVGELPQGYVQNEPVPRAYADRVGRGELATARGYTQTVEDQLRAYLGTPTMRTFTGDVGRGRRSGRGGVEGRPPSTANHRNRPAGPERWARPLAP